MQSIPLKIEFESTLRRANVPAQAGFADFKQLLAKLLDLTEFSVLYRDEEGDLVTIDSDVEFKDILEARHGGTKVTRFIVQRGDTTAAPPTAEASPPPKPKLPFEDEAKFFSDADNVKQLFATLSTHAVILDAVTSAAKLYLDSEGDFTAVLKHGLQQLPELRSVVEDTAQQYDLAALKDLLLGACGGGSSKNLLDLLLPVNPFDMFKLFKDAHCAAAPPRNEEDKEQEQQQQDRSKVHFGVVCDGCETVPELKQASLEHDNRGRGRGGFIRGTRFKSQSVHNFDLCETCHSSGLFQATHQPFLEVAPQIGCGGGRPLRGLCTKRAPPSPQPHVDIPPPLVPMPAVAVRRSPSPTAMHTPSPPLISKPAPKQEDDWVNVVAKWAPQLELLASLGFANLESYLDLLEEEKGDLEKVVNRIIRRES